MRYPSVLFFYLSTLSYFVTFVLYLLHVVFHPHPRPLSPPRERGDGGEGATLGIIAASASWGLSNIAWGVWATRALLASVILSGAGVIARAIELGNASQWVKVLLLPLSTTYETLTFFSWLIPLIYFVMERKFQIKQVGVFVTGAAFVMLSVAASPSVAPNAPTGVPPSLQSYWLTIHVLFMVLGIAFFTSGFGATLGVSMASLREEALSALWGPSRCHRADYLLCDPALCHAAAGEDARSGGALWAALCGLWWPVALRAQGAAPCRVGIFGEYRRDGLSLQRPGISVLCDRRIRLWSDLGGAGVEPLLGLGS
jgi:hypothetical protein